MPWQARAVMHPEVTVTTDMGDRTRLEEIQPMCPGFHPMTTRSCGGEEMVHAWTGGSGTDPIHQLGQSLSGCTIYMQHLLEGHS